MIIADLIRIGRAIARVGASPTEVIELITSVQEVGARNFYRHVFVAEILHSPDGSKVHVHPYVDWTDCQRVNGREVQVPQRLRACAAPFILPSGGNPRNAQGVYSLPVYIVYEKDFLSFGNRPDKITRFLEARLERTVQFELGKEELNLVAAGLSERFAECDTTSKERYLGLIILCKIPDDNAIYYYGDPPGMGEPTSTAVIESYFWPGRWIRANFARMLPLLWEAKFMEGAEKGLISKEDGGRCSFCGRNATVVSSYAKAWPWLTTTWEAPLPETLKDKRLVEAIALCKDCYQGLTFGASAFNSMRVTMNTWLTREIFSPNISASGKEASQGRKVDQVYGGLYALPVQENILADECKAEEFVKAYSSIKRGGISSKIQLEQIIGLEYGLPPELADDVFRLTILYFSGDPGRADIHLRAVIEDVIPSVAMQLQDILGELQDYVKDLYQAFFPSAKESDIIGVRKRYGSLPFLLANAYGTGYVWQSLAAALHRQPLSERELVRSSISRINEVSRKLPAELWRLRQEVLFYMAFKYFLSLYHHEISKQKEGVSVRPWQELQDHIASAPLEELTVQDVEELGFFCGHLVGDFSRRYWHATRTGAGGEGKDFLQTRVMTFGSSITPEVVIHRAMQRFADYGMRVGMKMAGLNDLMSRTGVILTKYVAMQDQVKRERDRFMLGFWAGYSLSGSRRERHQAELPADVG